MVAIDLDPVVFLVSGILIDSTPKFPPSRPVPPHLLPNTTENCHFRLHTLLFKALIACRLSRSLRKPRCSGCSGTRRGPWVVEDKDLHAGYCGQRPRHNATTHNVRVYKTRVVGCHLFSIILTSLPSFTRLARLPSHFYELHFNPQH